MLKNIPFQTVSIRFIIDILYINRVFPYVTECPMVLEFIESILPNEILNNDSDRLNLQSIWSNKTRVSKIVNRSSREPGPKIINCILDILSSKPKTINYIYEQYDVLWNKNTGDISTLKKQIMKSINDTSYFIDEKVIGKTLASYIINCTDAPTILTILTLFSLLGENINLIDYDWDILSNTKHLPNNIGEKLDENILEKKCICKIVKKINTGQHSITYNAISTEHNIPIVITAYSPTSMRNCALFRDYKLQWTCSNIIKHPNLSTLKKIIIDDDNNIYCLISEYIEGTILSEYFKTGSKITYDNFIEYAHQLIDAVSYLHDMDIVHGDINPSNIIISDKLHIIDYSDTNYAGSLATTEIDTTNISYWPPEKKKGEKYDILSDIYSVALVVYHMMKLCLNKFQTKYNTYMDIQDVCLKASNNKRENRYQSLGEFKKALDSAFGIKSI